MTDRYENVYEVEEAAPPPTAGERMRGVVSTVAGALLCVAVVVGLGWWLTDLGQREAGSLPVFRAEISPAKTRPANPGGAETPYQEIRSYEVAVGGATERAGSSLAPPPETPKPEDVAMGDLAPERTTPTLAAAAPAPAADAPAPRAEPEAPASEAVSARSAPEVSLPVPAPARDVAPSPTEPTPPSPDQQAIDEAAQLAARAAVSPVQIQLGAFTDRGYTENEWRRIAAAHRDLLSGRALAIQSTVSGGAKYYRLRVGPFRDRTEAKSVCEALKARGQDCLVAVNG